MKTKRILLHYEKPEAPQSTVNLMQIKSVKNVVTLGFKYQKHKGERDPQHYTCA